MVNALREELTVKENALEEMKKAVKEVSEFSTRNVVTVAGLSNKQTNKQTNKPFVAELDMFNKVTEAIPIFFIFSDCLP